MSSTRIEPVLDTSAEPALRAGTRDARFPEPPSRRGSWRWLLWLPPGLLMLMLLAVVLLRWLPPPTTAFILQSETQPVHYVWVPASKIAETARKAVVAAEDQKFWTHHGFDVEAIEKAYEHNQRHKTRIRGASTISQQTAKNLFLWPGGGYFRKGVEAMFTVLIEKIWGKDRVLEVYLNIAEFGPGIYGVEAASQIYFNRPAARLTPEQAALLAAVLPSPRRWNARSPGPYVQSRVAWVLRQMGYGPRVEPQDEPEPLEPLEDEMRNLPSAAPSDDPAETTPEPAAQGTEPEPPPPEPWPIPSE